MLSSGAGHVPALSGALSTVPSSQGSSCPPLPPVRGDELEAVSFHHRTSVGASGRSRSIWCPHGTQLRRSGRLGSPMHEYKPAGPCHGRGFRHPRGPSDRRPERALAKDARSRAEVRSRGDTRTDQPRRSQRDDRRHRQDNAPTVGSCECVRGPRGSHRRRTIPSGDARRRNDRVEPRHPSNLGSPTEFGAPGVPTA